MARVSIEAERERLEAASQSVLLEFNGSNMSGALQDGVTPGASSHPNGTAALGLRDQEMNAALFGLFLRLLLSALFCGELGLRMKCHLCTNGF